MSTNNPYFVSTKRNDPRQKRNIPLDYFAGVFITTFIVMIQGMGSEALRLDRFQHLGASLLLFLIFSWGLKGVRGRHLISITMAFFVGIGKELLDHQGDIFDIYANSLGLSLGVLFLLSTNFIYARRAC